MSRPADANAAYASVVAVFGALRQALGFAGRTWGAMLLALYAAFWIQLESPSTAAITVGILALPTRGLAFHKALFRLLATVVGVIVSIIIVSLFVQMRELYILVFAAWLSVCVYIAGFLDGDHAYAALLSGYTVATIAITQIDAPNSVFLFAMNRGAAIVVGIFALAIVNDIFAAPDTYPALRDRLGRARDQSRELVRSILTDGRYDPEAVAALLRAVTAFRLEILSMASESVIGRHRVQAAQNVVGAIVGQVSAVRELVNVLAIPGEDAKNLRAALVAAIDAGTWSDDVTLTDADNASGNAVVPLDMAVRLAIASEILTYETMIARSFAELSAGHRPRISMRLPIFRDPRMALRNGVRVFVTVVAAASLLASVSGWPATATSLSLLAIFATLSSTAPSETGFAKSALVAIPLMGVVSGFLLFVVLDGSDSFLALSLALAPPILGASAATKSSKPIIKGVGALSLFLLPVFLSPSNPQTYDPLAYLSTCILACTASIGLFIALTAILPASPRKRSDWIVDACIADCSRQDVLDHKQLLERQYRSADRFAQFAALLPQGEADRRTRLASVLFYGDLEMSLARSYSRVDDLTSGNAAETALSAIAARDPSTLGREAAKLYDMRLGRSADQAELMSGAAVALEILRCYVAREPSSLRDPSC